MVTGLNISDTLDVAAANLHPATGLHTNGDG
jgi:hypothetical protein